jgi:hypothetical protein
MDGRRSPQSPLISQLTSPLDQITSNCRRSRRTNSNHSRYGTFGFLVPILIDDDWRHIAGHGRDVAARLLDLKGIPQVQQAEFVRENCLTEPWD